jgi:hypothetical protein
MIPALFVQEKSPSGFCAQAKAPGLTEQKSAERDDADPAY